MGVRRKFLWRLYFDLVDAPNRRSQPLTFPSFVRHTKQLLSVLIFVASLLYLLGLEETLTVIASLLYCVCFSSFFQAKLIAFLRGKRGKNRSRVVPPLETILTDDEIVASVVSGETPSEELESVTGDCERAVVIRREALRRVTGRGLAGLPLHGFDYASSSGRFCELKVGCLQLPVGVPGPLLLDGSQYYVPMATTEGCLVASVSRGFKAIALSGGATSVIFGDGITRALMARLPSAGRAAELQAFLENPNNLETLTELFNRSSRFARLQTIKCALAGRNLYMRFRCSTEGDVGMNIISEGVKHVLDYLLNNFNDMEAIGTSSNLCSENKPVAVNWIEGRGKSVACEAIIKEEVVEKVLKTNIPALVELNKIKNLVGSAVAGSLGGFNAQASNITSAIFIATGQDPATNVESSQCITMIEALNDGKELHISVTLPSIEVGTIGRGTELAPQAACLDLLGVQGESLESPGANARRLATIVAGAVLAGELSLLSALAAGHLVKSHMKYNRSSNTNIGHQIK
ncbi:3-hydroxy-3-methylglutaryl-coenzyme A reductase 3-like [Curcuma longa]|uniref:3-hydroxy-3-methylglutaryl-coenzyme A reductase 3-like n=1 Tax=Curcuma longa TaxID=136217 RepID=UPI003D9EC77D